MIEFRKNTDLDEICRISSEMFLEPFPYDSIIRKQNEGYELWNVGFYSDNDLIGYCIVVVKEDIRTLHAWIGGTLPECRNNGFFSQFYSWLIHEAEKMDFRYVTANTDNYKPAMLIILIKKGFDIIDVKKTNYGDGRKIMLRYSVDHPIKVRLSITNQCNCNCFFCHHEGINIKNITALSVTQLENILIQLYKLNAREITITGGEPLCRSDLLIFIIRSCSKWAFPPKLKLITNGSLLTDAICSELAKYNGEHQLNISMHTTDDEKALFIFGRKITLSEYRRTFGLTRKYGLNVRINCTVLKGINDSVESLQAIAELASEFGISKINYMELLIKKDQTELHSYYVPFNIIRKLIEKFGGTNIVYETDKKIGVNFSSGKNPILLNIFRLGCRAGCVNCLKENDISIGADSCCYPCYLEPEINCGSALTTLGSALGSAIIKRQEFINSRDKDFAEKQLYWGNNIEADI